MSAHDFLSSYPLRRRLLYAALAMLLAVLIAGFWNFRLVDGFGRDFVAGNTIGDTASLAGAYGSRGDAFGLIFAAIAGLAATFTACNCVVFAMLPGLTCSLDRATSTRSALKLFAVFVAGVLAVSAIYGLVIGSLGPAGVARLNQNGTRLAQAQIVFTIVGALMLSWGLLEMGFAEGLKRLAPSGMRAFLASPRTKASILGVLVGLFAVGRPFPVFREFLSYAASAESPVYGAVTMMIQGIGQIVLMTLLFFLVLLMSKDKIRSLAERQPQTFRIVSGVALIAGGTYFIYYWGLSFWFDIGRWGFKLGWYG